MSSLRMGAERFFRDGAWLTRARIRGYSVMLILASLVMVGWILSGHGNNDPMGRPVGSDFLQFWSASWAVLHGQAGSIYSLQAFSTIEQTIFRREDTGVYAFLYPPTALLLVAPLALFPYLAALTLWLAVGLSGYLSALWRILPDKVTILAALAYPAVLLIVEQGQTTVLVTPLLAWGLLLIDRRPILAGILFGLLPFKPQLAPLIPLALIASGHWRVLISAGISFGVFVGLTIAIFGIHIWTDFLGIAYIPQQILDYGLIFPYFKMQSAFSAVRLLGGPVPLAYAVQAVASVSAVAAVFWAWRQPVEQGLKNAVLCAAIPLSALYMMDYDLLISAPAIAWLARAAIRSGGLRPWEGLIAVAVFILPLFARPVARLTHLEPAPLIAAALVAALVARIYASRQMAGGGSVKI